MMDPAMAEPLVAIRRLSKSFAGVCALDQVDFAADDIPAKGEMKALLAQLPKGPYYGILAEFATPADLYHACEQVRDAGFTRWDAHSPFPVHGLDKAMGQGTEDDLVRLGAG